MLGVVLCGGQSSRMGSDKCVLPIGNIRWADVAINIFNCLQLPAVLSVNEHQQHQYKNLFSVPMIVDENALQIGGPLKGIMSVFLKNPTKDLLVIACDMINMKEEVIKSLINSSSHLHDAVVYRNDEQVEPLCGIYTSKGLNKILHWYKQQMLDRHSMHFILKQLDTHYVDVPNNWKPCFKNYNAPADLG